MTAADECFVTALIPQSQTRSPPHLSVKGIPTAAYDEDFFEDFQAELEAAIIDHPPARPAEHSGFGDYVC